MTAHENGILQEIRKDIVALSEGLDNFKKEIQRVLGEDLLAKAGKFIEVEQSIANINRRMLTKEEIMEMFTTELKKLPCHEGYCDDDKTQLTKRDK